MKGLVPVRDLDDDYYEFDEKNYCLRGRRKNKIYSLGDAITVRVARANLEKKQLDFELIENKFTTEYAKKSGSKKTCTPLSSVVNLKQPL